jgi:hypothetical protein
MSHPFSGLKSKPTRNQHEAGCLQVKFIWDCLGNSGKVGLDISMISS